MIPNDPNAIAKMKELADRNIANGDWGDEVTIPGIPDGEIPMTPDERAAKGTISDILAKRGGRRLPKK